MKTIFSITLLFFCLIFGCKQVDKNRVNTSTPIINERDSHSSTSNTVLEIEVISISENTFGYNILKNGKIYIHQPHIPSVPGNKGFNTKDQARKAAEFVILKIEKNIIPPTITAAELDSLGVLD